MRKFSPRRAAAGGAMILFSSLLVGGNAFGAGANTTGPYDPTASGPSGNGVAYEHAGDHLPLAGSVGNADAKNPPGQLPGGSDANAGYECDTNQGVGQTNPAHTGCTTPPVQP